MDCHALLSSLLLALIGGVALSEKLETYSCSKVGRAGLPRQFELTESQWNRSIAMHPFAEVSQVSCALHCNGGRLGQVCAGELYDTKAQDYGVYTYGPTLNLQQCQLMYGGGERSPCEVCNKTQLALDCTLGKDRGLIDCTRNDSHPVDRSKRMNACLYERKYLIIKHSEYYRFQHGQIVEFERVRNGEKSTIECDCINGRLFKSGEIKDGDLKLCPGVSAQDRKKYRPGMKLTPRSGRSKVVRVFTPHCE